MIAPIGMLVKKNHVISIRYMILYTIDGMPTAYVRGSSIAARGVPLFSYAEGRGPIMWRWLRRALFLLTWWWHNPFATNCLHCGLRRGDTPRPET